METFIIILCSGTIFILVNNYIEKMFISNNEEKISNAEYKKRLKRSLIDKIEKTSKKRKKTTLDRKHLKILFNYKGEK